MRIEVVSETEALNLLLVQRMLGKQVDEFLFDRVSNKFTMLIWDGDVRDLDILQHKGFKVRRIYWWEFYSKKLAAKIHDYAKKYRWKEELLRK